MIKKCDCDACRSGAFNLHEGDRVVVARGNLTEPELIGLMQRLAEKALWVQGIVGKDTVVLVLAPGSETSSQKDLARKHGILEVKVDEFDRMVQIMTEGPRVQHDLETDFFRINLLGQKVLPSGLDATDSATLRRYVESRGGEIGQQRRASLAAAVCHQSQLSAVDAKILRSIGVPVFAFEQVRARLS